jgi:hypothetical protein
LEGGNVFWDVQKGKDIDLAATETDQIGWSKSIGFAWWQQQHSEEIQAKTNQV